MAKPAIEVKATKHVDTQGIGCKPNKIAKLEAEVIEIEDDDFEQLCRFRKSGLVKRKSKTHTSRRYNSVVGLGDCFQPRNDGDHKNKLESELEEQPRRSVDKIGVEFCPICQFPLQRLTGQNAACHVDDCLASCGSTDHLGECPEGMNCTSSSQGHFKTYLHTQLAYARSNCDMSVGDLNISGKAEENRSNPCDVIAGAGCQTNVRSSPDNEDLNLSADSLEHISFSDDSYERILSELVDDLENDDTIASNNIGCDSLKAHANENQRSVEMTSTTMPNVRPSMGVTAADGPVTAVKPLTLAAKKLQQTNLACYFGVKDVKKSNANSSDQEQSIHLSKQFNINYGAKNGNRETNYVGDDGRGQNFMKIRTCPFYKKIPGTSITVDAFSYGNIPGCTAYFLSHYHYDHYRGLKKTFTNKIYCSKVTAKLVHTHIKVNENYIHSLPMNKEVVVDDIKVTLLDANHCPGSVMFLFVRPDGSTVLHTGDFRADTSMGSLPLLQNIKIDTIYLDTTYCNPSYSFPTQQKAIDFAVEKSCQAVHSNPKTLIVCGTYTVGKERVFLSIANALDSKICTTKPKKRVLDCLEWPELANRLTAQWNLAQVHVLPMNQIKIEALRKHLSVHNEFREVIAFKPTGWTYKEGLTDLRNIKPSISGSIAIYGIPYSEHSSFTELEWFLKRFKPGKIIPTVNNGTYAARNSMQKIFDEWLHRRR